MQINNTPTLQIVITSVLLLLYTLIISHIYGLIIGFSPLIYINFLITVGFGLSLGIGVKVICRLCQIFDKKLFFYFGISSGDTCGLFFLGVICNFCSFERF